LTSTAGPDEGSLTVTFGCPACGHRVAMLTNPWETQLVRTLGVKVGGRATEAAPFEQVRASLTHQRDAAFVEEAAAPDGSAAVAAGAEGPGCPFAAMIPGFGSTAEAGPAGPAWAAEAGARLRA